MLKQGGGAIVNTASIAGLLGFNGIPAYVAAKHGVVGLMRSYANALASHRIRCNTVHTSGVNSPMVVNEAFKRFVAENPDGVPDSTNSFPVELLDVSDVSKAIIFLCSAEGQYITGVTLPVDAGLVNR